jgi:EAL and modified HD-GYP domain-containing signal transduction protein
MQDHPILAHVVMGYSPMIDRHRTVFATRLTLFPERPDVEVDAPALLAALAEVWPDEAVKLTLSLRALDPASGTSESTAATGPRASLNLAGESLLQGVMAAAPGAQLMIEVPAFMAADPAHASALRELHAAGRTLLIKGRPLAELPREVLPCFSHSIIDLSEERRGTTPPPGIARNITTVQSGVRTQAEIEAAFKRGAVAVIGWPVDDVVAPPKGRASVPPDLQVIMELINGVDQELPVDRLESVLRRDPTLAFRLMRYLNSPAFGMSVEINSFRHALMMLGYSRLKRWLALLLVSASKDVNMKPVMFAALRRGLLMEELVRGSSDAEMRGEMFICGVFSLLNHMLKLPFDELLKSLPVPDRVRDALVSQAGPFAPYLDLVRAIENEALFDIRECADQVFMGLLEINSAVLRALRSARQLDS